MAHKDWDPDELLEFNYKRPVPGREEHTVSDKEALAAAQRRAAAASKSTPEDQARRLQSEKAAVQQQAARKVPENKIAAPPQSNEILPPLSEGRSARVQTGSGTESRASADELRRYAELRHSNTEGPGARVSAPASSAYRASAQTPSRTPDKAGAYAAARKSGSADQTKKSGKPRKSRKSKLAGVADMLKKPDEPEVIPSGQDYHRTQEDAAALRQAQQEAYERYQSTYSKNYLKNKKNLQPHFSHKLLSILYLIAVVAFAVSLTIMDVLPFSILAMIYAILILLSLIIVMHLRKKNIRRWIRVFASFAAVMLIGCYSVGTAYALGTLSFLDFTSVKNENRVASITEEPFNVVITGIDVNGKIDEEGRSDVNMVVTVNPKTAQILMTSIPRDYQIYMPDKDNAMDKLTHTGFYGIETTIGAEEELLDTKMNYFVKVNFSTVKKFVNAIGGIDVYSEYEFVPVKLDTWTVHKGMNHMNGKQALAFARERKAFPTGDNQRVKNQQAVFEAIIKKATSSKTMLLSYNKVLSSIKKYYKMSISSSEFRSLIKNQIAKDPDWKIYKNALIGGDGSMGTYTTGYAAAYVMLQDETSIMNARELIQAVLNGNELAEDDEGVVYVKDAPTDEEGEA